MLHSYTGSVEEDFEGFIIYGHSIMLINFHFLVPKTFHTKFG